MRRRSFIFLASLAAVLAVGAVGLVAYDRGRDNRIAENVTIGNVQVGGLTAAQARTRLAGSLNSDLNQPVVVHGEGRTFRLTPRAASARYDIDGMVDAAVRRSRRGNILTRSWRDLRGAPLNATLSAHLSYSRGRLLRFVRRVDKAVSRDPVDATVEFGGGQIKRIAGKDGLHVSFPRLRKEITAALLGADADRTVYVHTERRRPKVVKAELEQAYPKLLTIDRSNFKLRYYRNLKLVKTYDIAVGAVGFDTPSGLYHIQNKAVNPAWSVPNSTWAGSQAGTVVPGGTAANPLKARWLGIYNGAGIHGTAESGSIGSAASHGCIRMRIPDVIELYERVPVSTPVYIA